MIKTFKIPQVVCALGLILITQLSAQKISIQFTTTPTPIPTVAKAALRFDKDFAFSYTIDDATIDAVTSAYPVFRGGVVRATGASLPGLFYTDGCGNNMPFNAGIAWNTANLFGIDVHVGNVADQLTWGQLDTLYEAGWDVMNHSYAHRSKSTMPLMAGTDYINEVEQNNIAVRNKTRKKVGMPVFVVPANDDNYHAHAINLGHKLILDQSPSTIGYGGLRVDNIQNLYALKVHRTYLGELYAKIIPSFIDTVALRSKNGVKMWYNEFSHRLDDFSTNSGTYNFNYFKSHIENIANKYGKAGADRMWMAPPQEVYEYLVTRETATFTSQLIGNRLDLSFNTLNIPSWVRRKTMTLVVNSTADFNNVIVPAGVKVTFRGTGTQKIINLDFTAFVQGTPVTETPPSVLKVSPNPVTNFLAVDCETLTEGKVRATIFDISGKIMYQKDFEQPKFQVPTTQLANGLYFLMVRQGKQIYRGKFVKNGE